MVAPTLAESSDIEWTKWTYHLWMKENCALGQKENIKINLRKNVKNQAGILSLKLFSWVAFRMLIVWEKIGDHNAAIGTSWPLEGASNALLYKGKPLVSKSVFWNGRNYFDFTEPQESLSSNYSSAICKDRMAILFTGKKHNTEHKFKN